MGCVYLSVIVMVGIALPPCYVVPPRRSGAESAVVKGKLYMFGVSFSLVVDDTISFMSSLTTT